MATYVNDECSEPIELATKQAAHFAGILHIKNSILSPQDLDPPNEPDDRHCGRAFRQKWKDKADAPVHRKSLRMAALIKGQ